MKRVTVLITGTILLISFNLSAQFITLSFTGAYGEDYLPLDSICIVNLTQECDTALYPPDTLLLLEYFTGLEENPWPSGLILEQNRPNPFSGMTEIRLWLPAQSDLFATVYDLRGRKHAVFSRKLPAGSHRFIFYPGGESCYILSVKTPGAVRSIRMLSLPGDQTGQCRLDYEGTDGLKGGDPLHSISGGFQYEAGDELRYLGFAHTAVGVAGSDVFDHCPDCSMDYVFDISEGMPCPEIPLLEYEGKKYRTVEINGVCWMKENMNHETDSSWCWGNDPANCEKYGRLYNWEDAQEVCPEGWMIPYDVACNYLEGSADSQYSPYDPVWDTTGWRGFDAGLNLKSRSAWDGENSSGFSSLAGGYKNIYGDFSALHLQAAYWTATEAINPSGAWSRMLESLEDRTKRQSHHKSCAFSVRCLYSELTGLCAGTPTVTYGGQVYNTILIGSQCWLKENLNVGAVINGSQNMSNNGIIEKYCYGNDTSNCATYGGLYQWNEAMQYISVEGAQGICPPGWHLPADEEWKQLEGTADSQYGYPDPEWDDTGWRGYDVGLNLKATSGWYSGGNGTDLYGFGALPGGLRGAYGSFYGLGSYGDWWSSSENSGSHAWYRHLYYDNVGSYRQDYYKTHGRSVRCLLDYQNTLGVQTGSAQNINETSAAVTGEITDLGGSTVFHHGHCWSETQGPDIYDYTTDLGSTNSTGPFTSLLDNLTANTIYYVKAYAENSLGIAYGDEISFTTYGGGGEPCPGMPTVTDIDGNVYSTVLIGNQCWMAENLKTTTYNNGTNIPNVPNASAWSTLTTGAYVWYDNNISWKDKYGALYNWFTTVDPNGLCPTGWHVPTHDEWADLTDYIGGTGSPHGNELKSCRQVNSPFGGGCNTSEHPRWNYSSYYWGTDIYGFSGLPGGYRQGNGAFNRIGDHGYWWSSTEYSLSSAWIRYLSYSFGSVYEYYYGKQIGFSVRCLRDY